MTTFPVRTSTVVLAVLCTAAPVFAAPPSITLETLSSIRTTPRSNGAPTPALSPAGASIILSHDAGRQRVLVVNQANNRVEVIDISDPAAPIAQAALDMNGYGPLTTSVAVSGDLLAVAVTGTEVTDPGSIVFFDEALQHVITIPVGALPDMITFSPGGRYLLVSNEGEPSDPLYRPGVIDPEGSVSIIDVTAGYHTATVCFTSFNGQAAALREQGVHLNGPGATVAQDLEPEWITVSQDSKTAWVTLQENNAIAIIDIRSASVKTIAGLGMKDHTMEVNAFDASDRDSAISIRTWPVHGLYQPDAIEAVRIAGKDYLVIANEGAGRDVETARVASLSLDPVIFPDAAVLKMNGNLGRLNVSKTSGDTNGDGKTDILKPFGGRSFSILSASGEMLWDSGSQFETTLANLHPLFFNASNSNNLFDDRSDDKGPEPEGVALGMAFGRNYAFIAMERIGGVMVYDISTPTAPVFVEYVNNRDFTVPVALEGAGDLGAEGMAFIKADDSPGGIPLLVVANEVSGTTTIFEVVRQP